MSEPTKKEESQAGKSMAMPADMKAFNAKLIADFRANRGQFTGPMAGRSLLILTTTGARSGKERTAVLGYGRDGDRLVVIASDNGAPGAPAWYHKPEERAELAKAVPYLEQQQSLTKREIPIIVLERS